MNQRISLEVGTALVLLIVLFFFWQRGEEERLPLVAPDIEEEIPAAPPVVSVIAEGLEIPWDIAFLPGGGMLVSERPGRLLLFDADGGRREIAYEGARHTGEGGLLGITLHPDFSRNNLLYVYATVAGTGGRTLNRVERYHLSEGRLTDQEIIIDGVPGASYHDGGRIEFGPDGFLYITTGDAGVSRLSQDLGSPAGKLLRLTESGAPAPGNPFDSAVYSYGHRNSQGLAWDAEGRLWSTEHGRSGVFTGMDEINLILSGGNYGWPENEGDRVAAGTAGPALHSGPNATWAPASAAYLDGSLFFGGLRGEALYEAVLEGERVVELKEHFKNEFGRIRTVRVGPDGMLYLTTSNRDGRRPGYEGEGPFPGDDKIIRVNPAAL